MGRKKAPQVFLSNGVKFKQKGNSVMIELLLVVLLIVFLLGGFGYYRRGR
jgi:hypothetical protein